MPTGEQRDEQLLDHLILPDDQRLSIEQLIADLEGSGKHARHLASVQDIVDVVGREARAGDLVVVMSNGGFDNIHQRLLEALEARGAR